jgi:hypothetical protein
MIPILVYLAVLALLIFDVNQHIDEICESLFYEEDNHIETLQQKTFGYNCKVLDNYPDYDCNLY